MIVADKTQAMGTSGPLRIESGELSADEIISALNEGRRVIVRTQLLGTDYEVTLRRDGDTYYCDTPTTLHKHRTEAEMRGCLANQGYSRA